MYSDYHVHSCFSFDSKENPENIIRQAIQLNMKQICFTEHQDYNWPDNSETPLVDLDSYTSTVLCLREKYADRIQILKGIELGLANENSFSCEQLLASNDFDFIIGSCHIVDGMDPYYSKFWKNRNDREAFELYFDTTLEGLKSFYNIDALGHMDYIVRYSPNKNSNYSVSDYRDIIDEILKFIIAKNIKLEINTANFSKGFDFPNPHTDIIKRYKELGGMYVTIGSDAHSAQYIGNNFNIAEKIVHKFNLKVYTKDIKSL